MLEPNDSISEVNSVVNLARSQSVSFSESIDRVSDIDLYEFQLNEGQGAILDIDTITTAVNQPNLDLFLRVFDAEGTELDLNDDSSADSGEFSLDPYLGFIANETGSYYVGISTADNFSYDPLDNSNTAIARDNFVAGDYELTLDLVEVVADKDPDSTIAEAVNTDLNSNPTGVFEEEIETVDDVDFYQVELARGEVIKIDLSAREGSDLDSYLRLFDAAGNELAFNDNSLDPEVTTDAVLSFSPAVAGEYFIGVSSAGNIAYDRLNGNTNLNFSNNRGISMGEYELKLEVLEMIADTDPDNTIAEAVAVEPGAATPIAEQIDLSSDVDLYAIDLKRGERVSFDLDTLADSTIVLDTILRVFDGEGNELAFNDDGAAADEIAGLESYLEFTALDTDTYYVGVSSYGNNYDPLVGGSIGENTASRTGNYELEIATLEPVNVIEGGKLADSLTGTNNPDLLAGGNGADTISGGELEDILRGDLGNDLLQGDGGDDLLEGGSGADELRGGLGNDILVGGDDNDLLFGNEGEDLFIVRGNNGADTIADFEVGTDRIMLVAGLRFADLRIASDGAGNTTIDFENDIIVSLTAIAPGEITSADFII